MSKTIIYMISEVEMIDSRDMEKNENLKAIVEKKSKYNITVIILLTHSDIFCDKIKKEEPDNWKTICSTQLINNKKNLLDWINKIINNDYKINEYDIKHVMLQDNEKEITEEEIINSLDEDEKIEYNKVDDASKKFMLKAMKKILMKKQNEVKEFLKNEMKVLGVKELIEEMKSYIPSQYQNTFVEIK